MAMIDIGTLNASARLFDVLTTKKEIAMRSTMTITAFAAAALLGSTLMASAQTAAPATGPSGQNNNSMGTTAPMDNQGSMTRSGNARDGMTTGAGSGSMSRDGMSKTAPTTTGPSGQNTAPSNGTSR